jgi:hypothetical protein
MHLVPTQRSLEVYANANYHKNAQLLYYFHITIIVTSKKYCHTYVITEMFVPLSIICNFKTLIKSYLTGRHQRVVLDNKGNNGSTSKWEMIKCGVPQGSILGPLLFLFYINDLPKILNKDNYMVLYADDTSIIITDRNKSES